MREGEPKASGDDGSIRGLYVMAFTPARLEASLLQAFAQQASGVLQEKDARFRELMASMGPKTRIEISNLEYVSTMHTPQTMQSALAGWLHHQYNLPYDPRIGENFFPLGLKGEDGSEKYLLFYFDGAPLEADFRKKGAGEDGAGD